MLERETQGREASLSAGAIASQSVNTTESGGERDDDAGKEVKGRKRHILTDTLGLLVGALAILLISKIAMAHPLSGNPSVTASLGCAILLLTATTPPNNCHAVCTPWASGGKTL